MESSSIKLYQGTFPVIISMPHNGSAFPQQLESQFLTEALCSRDTDWFLDRLYEFAKTLGCSLIKPHFSRYIIDLNRAVDGSALYPGSENTELCPTTGFDRMPLYPEENIPDHDEIETRKKEYWYPYHQALSNETKRLRNLFPEVIILEAHSIASHVERFFSGKLDDFNFGNNDGKSSSFELIQKLQDKLELEQYSCVFNGRFKGGYITREYGKPEAGVHTIQLELSQDTYMDESTLSWDERKATKVIPKLKQVVEILLGYRPSPA